MDATIIVAGIGAAGVVVASWIGGRRNREQLNEAIRSVQQQVSNVHVSIGHPNGKGNVTEMLENLIEWKGAHTAEHEALRDQCPLFDHDSRSK